MTLYTRTITEECEAMQFQPGFIDQDKWPLAVVRWVESLGGEARYEPAHTTRGDIQVGTYDPDMGTYHPARIAVRTKDGDVYAAPGWHIVKGSVQITVDFEFDKAPRTVREFTVCDPETFQAGRWTVKS